MANSLRNEFPQAIYFKFGRLCRNKRAQKALRRHPTDNDIYLHTVCTATGVKGVVSGSEGFM